MLNKLFAITQFKNIWLILPLLLAVLYIPQAIWGLHFFDDKYAVQLIVIVILGLLVYLGAFWTLRKVASASYSYSPVIGSLGFVSKYFVVLVSILYFLFIGYAISTAEKIAFLEALRDASVDEIAVAREALFKTRDGWEKILPYLNAILSSALMPFAIALAYLNRMNYRHWLLFFFCLSLLISMEKALILKAFLPIIAIGFQNTMSRNKAVILILVPIGVVGALFYFAKMGQVDYQGQVKESISKLEQQLANLPEIRQKDFKDIENSIKANEASVALFNRQLADLPRIKQKDLKYIDLNIKRNSALIGDYRSSLPGIDGTNKIAELERSNRLLREQRRKNIEYYSGYEESLKSTQLKAKLAIQYLQDHRIKNIEYYQNYEKEVSAAINSEKVAYESHYKYNVLTGGQAAFAFNRLLWIPYVTAYDWLKYFDQRLNNEFLGGKSSLVVSHILGLEKFPIEREVFKYQFGDGGPETGSANALFFVDAFVNFGWIGVIAYASLLSFIVFLVYVANNPAMMACLYFYLVQAVSGGLLGILFGNGLLLLICLSFFVRPNDLQKDNRVSRV